MKIIGQRRILAEVDPLLSDMLNGNNYNILFRARSGYGKSALALNILWHLGWDKSGEYLIPENNRLVINTSKRVHVIDEVHTLNEPEFLYPLMDSGQYIFILCSNESGQLLEPLRRRCIQFIFDTYTNDDMVEIVRLHLPNYPDNLLRIIAERTKNSPGEAVILCRRVEYLLRWVGRVSEDDLRRILDEIIQVDPNGIGPNERVYLEYLGRVGNSSLRNISMATGIDEATIRSEIEPYLLYLGKIKITSKGRIIC